MFGTLYDTLSPGTKWYAMYCPQNPRELLVSETVREAAVYVLQ
jgi:hypothetical protein